MSADWADLPELEPAGELILQSMQLPAFAESDTPTPQQEFHHFEDTEVLWSAGLLNRSPSSIHDVNVSEEEYDTSSPTDSVLHIDDPTLFPPFLHPGQRLVIRLPGMPSELYRVNLATTGGDAETIKEEYLDKERVDHRQLSIRWNDHLLWQRWLPPVFTVTKAAIPPESVSEHSNLLSLANLGTKPIPLDALWIDLPPTSGSPFYVALEDAQWLNQADSAWVKHTRITLSLPEIQSSWQPPVHSITPPPLTPKGLAAAWADTRERYLSLQEADPDLASAFQPSIQKVHQAISRGMLASVEVRTGTSNTSAAVAQTTVYLFGGLFHTWHLSNDPHLIDALASLKKQHPQVQLIHRSRKQTGDVFDAGTTVQYPLTYNGLLSRRISKYRQFFDGEIDRKALEAALKETLTLRALFRGYIWRKQAYHSDEFFSGAGDHLMYSDQPLTVHGGFPGSPFFPAGDDTPGLMWHYLKPLFRFGGPAHFKITANVTPDNASSSIGRSSWAAASNGKDSVQVLVHNHLGLNNRMVNLEVPVPWTGPTRILLHSVETAWFTTKTPEAKQIRRELEAKGEGDTGWLKIPFGLQGIQVFELAPVGSNFPRHIQAPEKVGFTALHEVKTLFDISRHAPPPWWSRIPMGAHFFAYWRYSGNVSLDVNVDATRDQAPDWAPLKAIHIALEENVKAVAPLRDTSTRFHFKEEIPNVAQVLRAGYNRNSTTKGEKMGLWLRAHPPPGFKAKFDPFHAIPRTQFYMGKLPYRQLIDVEYGTWYFISSDAEIWQRSVSRHRPYLMFWPAHPEDGNPVIEVNAFEMFQVRLKDMPVAPEKCLGFLQDDEKGNLSILVLGVPGKPAFWRQRLPALIDPDRLHHAVDKALLTTADTPEEDPPERVRHQVRLLEDAKILEIEIEKMPAPPSPSHLKKIEKIFPLLQNVVSNRELGVFLMETGEPSE